MNKKPQPLRTQTLDIDSHVEGGGYLTIGTARLNPGFGLYHESQIENMKIAERGFFFPYLLSVLSILGHQGNGGHVQE